MKILITGSSGYIGSCCYEYFKKKFDTYGLDKDKPKINYQKKFYKCNLLNHKKLDEFIKQLKPEVIIHLAGQSTVDFIKNKKNYIQNNNLATKNLINSIKKNKIPNLIFSSTAAVYKSSERSIKENSLIKPNNIYGKTKLFCENYIKSCLKENKNINYIILRFFNVCSSLPTYKIGEFHNPETHLVPIMAKKLKNKEKVFIYGKDYKTRDGTCIRDYIHILDIIIAFHKSITFLKKNKKSAVINLGTNVGFSCLEIFENFKKHFLRQNNILNFKKRRKGDVSKLLCDNKKAYKLLSWKPKNSKIKKIISDEIKWLKILDKKKLKRITIY